MEHKNSISSSSATLSCSGLEASESWIDCDLRHFHRQAPAIKFAKECEQDVHVFSKEISWTGSREFFVLTLHKFWHMYSELEPEMKHYYEVITEGSPCKLYFDLEFPKELNKNSNGPEMVDIWIKFVCEQLKKDFEIPNCNRTNVIDLDSSTDEKFSRHLIFCLPGVVFEDNIHVGNFVKHICRIVDDIVNPDDDNEAREGPDPKRPKMTDTPDELVRDLTKLFVNKEKNKRVMFCDQGVYTKNRNFRLFKSTKYDRDSFLEVAKENKFKPDITNREGTFSQDEDYHMFLDSLICNVSHTDIRVLKFEADSPKRSTPKASRETHKCQDSPISGYQRSPYPQLDEFITSIVIKGGVQGKIRQWTFFSEGWGLTYDIAENRWCENIRRQHKSNHIMMVVDLNRGVYYQKCHDPECKEVNFKSKEKEIPKDILDSCDCEEEEF